MNHPNTCYWLSLQLWCHAADIFPPIEARLCMVCRDLKPENVLLTISGDVKLSDFGLGHLPNSSLHSDMLQTTCGTPNYVAPEVLRREGYYGAPADIWSLG